MDISFTNVLEGARQYFAGLPAASNPAQRENDGSSHSEQHSAVPYWDQQQTGEPNMNTMNQPQANRQQNYYEKQNYAYPGHQVVYQQQQTHSGYYEVPTQPQQQTQAQVPYSSHNHANHTNHSNQTNRAYSNHNHVSAAQTSHTVAASHAVQRQQGYGYQTAAYHNYGSATPSSSQGQEYNYNKIYGNNNAYQSAYYRNQSSSTMASSTASHVPSNNVHYQYSSQNKPVPVVVPTSSTQRAQPVNGNSTNTNTNNVEYYKYYQSAVKYSSTNQYTPQSYPVVPSKPVSTTTYAQQKSMLAKQKRESPLDLSVKTVKTSADSTLDFEDRNYRVMMQQYQTARAPKVDFLPNFNVPVGDPKTVMARGAYYHNYSNNGNNNKNVTARETLPRVEFPSIPQRKRVVEGVSPVVVPEKIAKIDTWRQNIDKQIEQRLSSYTKSRTESDTGPGNNGNYMHSNYRPGNKQTATKKVLNLLRNSLQIKGQKKMEQDLMLKQSYREIQQPSTDVLAPLQPKPSIVGRRNISPFTAASLERNSATPSTAYKLHIPKAIDSVIFGENQDVQAQTANAANADLDGLAAYLAARIRTKAELKQVGPSSQTTTVINNQLLNNNNNKESVIVANNTFNKVNAEPKKLFNRYDGAGLTGLKQRGDVRSSSETSVFDFPDSDNEGEVAVGPSLLGMRKDRKTTPAQFTGKEEVVENQENRENERPVSPFDLIFNNTCDTFMEQLKNGCGKKRGRRKKAKNEEETNPSPTVTGNEIPCNIPVKTEMVETVKIKEEVTEIDETVIASSNNNNKVDHTSDSSDTPLSNLIKSEKVDDCETPLIPLSVFKPGKKPTFGDGSDFHPGWEMELYRYKKSLRMPRMLIQVTRPPNCSRLSTSLPDLDPSPVSPQSIGDKKMEDIDTDIDSNCSFNFSITRTNYDSEEGSSSVKSLKSSISDKLLERYGARRKKRAIKKQEESVPKIIPKTDTALLATPSLEKDSPVKTLLNFRKKTINNFKDAFSHAPINEFTTVVLNSRTRKETRVLKQKATIREVFGEDRPASAPPVTCLEESIKIKDQKSTSINQSLNDIFLKTLSNKIVKQEIKTEEIKKENELVLDPRETIKKKSKLRTIRRKLSSGFDYIRKKKKIKKEDFESDVTIRPKKRNAFAKSNPESIQDIQKEIKMWVLNKGVGETHLHRASRLGFTDIAAYCLENMTCNPSPRDNAGYTPLHEACSKGHLDIAKLLLTYGANVSESAQGGIRPLHEAAENGFVEIVRLLLSFGADPTLATYSGITPLQLAVDDTTVNLLKEHIAELQGQPTPFWSFNGPTSCFDPADMGFDVLSEVPEADKPEQEQDLEIEMSEQMLPNLYYLPGHESERWVLLQDLSNILKIKSKETLLRQLNVVSSNINKSDVVREIKTVDFLEKARCCQFLNANEKLNIRSSKVYLVKYNEKVKSLLNVESVVLNVR